MKKRLKRENGTGTVYKRKDLKSRPWVASFYANGQREYQYFASAQAAKDALEDFRRNPVTKINITLSELYNEWQPIGLQGKSRQLNDSYRAAYNKLAALHNDKFRDLRTAQYQRIVNDLQTERFINGKTLKPMSYSALHDIKILLGLLYKYAMQNDIINKNYADFIVLPKNVISVKECFNDLELKKIESSVGKIEFADCILFMCYTGLRISEFVGLTESSVRCVDGIYALYGGVKTDAGKNRIVPLPDKLVPILTGWKGRGGHTVFCRADGAPYSTNYFRRFCYIPALAKMGVRPLNPHATRRTYATMLSRAGVKEDDFVALMGHSDFKVDIDYYIRQTAEKLKPVVDSLA